MCDSVLIQVNSRPCHIQADNSTVPLPKLSSVLEASCAHASASSDSSKSFIGSCRLALLVRRLQVEVCTLGAVSEERLGSRKVSVRELIKKVEELFGEWREMAVGSRARPTGVSGCIAGSNTNARLILDTLDGLPLHVEEDRYRARIRIRISISAGTRNLLGLHGVCGFHCPVERSGLGRVLSYM
jgi:hypothetical protein